MPKNLFFATFIVMTVFSVAVLGCDPGPAQVDNESDSDPVRTVVEEREEIPLGKKSEYLQLLQTELDDLRKQTGLQPAVLDDVFIIPGEKKSYLAAKGKDGDGQCANIAVELEAVESGEILSKFSLRPEIDTCTGNPCESCTFLRDENDDITGCDCQQCPLGCNPSGGLCNHTVSSG